MSISDRDAQLEALRTAVNDFTDKQIKRLKIERKFLESVLANTADAATRRSRIADEVAAIESARTLVGLE